MNNTEFDSDTELESLTAKFQKLKANRNAYAEFSIIERVYGLLRRSLMTDDAAEQYGPMCEYLAAKYPDAYDILIFSDE